MSYKKKKEKNKQVGLETFLENLDPFVEIGEREWLVEILLKAVPNNQSRKHSTLFILFTKKLSFAKW